ncbi:MAG: RNase P modulator RnpM [Bacillota bacterium]|jgi:predicted RNA-binding protein YlxR (DUF448 family)/ribosomal protein L7Ae-like RNA K-turn-binding protein
MASKSRPQRMCIGCREFKDKKTLMRIVRTPEGELLLDPTGKKSGRGAYLCFDRDCLKMAIKNKSLEKAFKTKIKDEVLEAINQQMPEALIEDKTVRQFSLSDKDEKIANYIGLAQRAGKIIAGDAMAISAVKSKKAKLVIVANDAATQVKRDFEMACESRKINVYYWQNKVVLGYIVGKSARGALAILDAGFAMVIEKMLQDIN